MAVQIRTGWKMKSAYSVGAVMAVIAILLMAYAKGHSDGRRQAVVECTFVDLSVLEILDRNETDRAKRRLSMCISGSLDYLDSKSPWLRDWSTSRLGRTAELLEKIRASSAWLLKKYHSVIN